jgi:hypothetical protein
MRRIQLAGVSVIALTAACASLARADDVSAKKILVKDNASAAKRHVLVQSADPGIQLPDAVDPATHGAALHLYSASDDFCVILPAGPAWVNKNDKAWKYKNKGTRTSAQLKRGKLLVKVGSGIGYTLSDDGTQGIVNAQVRFGAGPKLCMRCSGNKKDTASKFLGKDCPAAPCDPEPSACDVIGTTTSSPTTTSGGIDTTSPTSTTVATTTSVSTTTVPSGGVVLKGALTATPGRFNYNLTVGLPGANAACNTSFPGTHACTYQELQSAQAAGDLDGLKDTGGATVTSFWAIDSSQPPLQQCQDDVVSFLNWEYATAHTSSRGQKVELTNATGVLGSLQSNLQCNFSNAWVGCCQ